MSNAIQFLETLGREPVCRSILSTDHEASIAALSLDQAQRDALLDRDHGKLSQLLGGRAKMMLQIWAPDQEPQEDEPAPVGVPDDGQDDEAPTEHPAE
jgi:hypothetical protein